MARSNFACGVCGCEVDITGVLECANCGVVMCDDCAYDSPKVALEYWCGVCLDEQDCSEGDA